MAVRDIFKVSRKTFINPTGWIGYESLKFQNQTMWAVLKNLFTTAKPERKESFKEAMHRLKLSEEDVKYGAVNYRILAMIFLAIGLLFLIHSFYLLFHHSTFLGWFLGLGASGLFFAQAFRYDFWSLQMRRRKLGITFSDWKQSILGNNKDSSK